LVCGRDDLGRHYILDEYYQTGVSEQQLAEIAKDLMRKYGIQYFVCVTGDTQVSTINGDIQIRDISLGDMVWTRNGYRKVNAKFTIPNKQVYRITMEDGRHIDATADHPLWVDNVGWRSVSLLHNDIICGKEVSLLCVPQQKNRDSDIGQGSSGNITTDLFQLGTTSIISTGILRTIQYPTLPASLPIIISENIVPICTETGNQLAIHGCRTSVLAAAKNFSLTALAESIAVQSAGIDIIARLANHTNIEHVSTAESDSELARIQRQELVPLRVVTISLLEGKQTVYDIRVEESHEFLANGILSHNCDSADPRWIRALRAHMLPAIAAKKTVGSAADPSSGIGLCYATLNRKFPDNTHGLYVSPKCVSFRREIENYVRDEPSSTRNPSEKPRKLADHSLDAWRYAEIAIEHFWGNPAMTQPTRASISIL
jgi:hypothetical protein